MQALSEYKNRPTNMKKLFCILASATLLWACEKNTEVAAPATPPPQETKADAATKRLDPTLTLSRSKARALATSAENKADVPTVSTSTVSPTP